MSQLTLSKLRGAIDRKKFISLCDQFREAVEEATKRKIRLAVVFYPEGNTFASRTLQQEMTEEHDYGFQSEIKNKETLHSALSQESWDRTHGIRVYAYYDNKRGESCELGTIDAKGGSHPEQVTIDVQNLDPQEQGQVIGAMKNGNLFMRKADARLGEEVHLNLK